MTLSYQKSASGRGWGGWWAKRMTLTVETIVLNLFATDKSMLISFDHEGNLFITSTTLF